MKVANWQIGRRLSFNSLFTHGRGEGSQRAVRLVGVWFSGQVFWFQESRDRELTRANGS
jgi:hypothetical protein